MIALEEKFRRSLPVRFTQDELRGKADELADKVARREGLEEEKKRVGADYKARIDATTSDINLLARHITERCEYQQVECQAWLDWPVHGKKTIFRVDTGEEVGVETMQPADRQTAIQWEKEANSHNVNPLETVETQPAAEAETAEGESEPQPVEGVPAGEGPLTTPFTSDGNESPADAEPVEHDTGGMSHEAQDEPADDETPNFIKAIQAEE
jgi:hypothetical protein